ICGGLPAPRGPAGCGRKAYLAQRALQQATSVQNNTPAAAAISFSSICGGLPAPRGPAGCGRKAYLAQRALQQATSVQ
ncbi:hypothetical protein CKJ89_37990, partial [Klebsiella pneumoniae]